MIKLYLQFFGGRGSAGSRGGGGGMPKAEKETIANIDALSKPTGAVNYTEDGDMRMNPIPSSKAFHGDPDDLMDHMIGLDGGEPGSAFTHAKLQEIPTSKLRTVQDTVNADRMKGMVSSQGVEKSIAPTSSGDGIAVVKYKGEYVISDGNHRAAIAKLAGKKTVRAFVIQG